MALIWGTVLVAVLLGVFAAGLRASAREERGLKLLREWLSQEQLAQFDANNYFEVIGCHSGKRYRICHGNGANIVELDDHARPTTGWCFVPGEHLVAGDVMLAQKIALETDERGALEKANRFTPR
ncbi:MAG TPA: hypothetical protein VK620_20865 [Bradyrhizobium sp.]|nr:hypothetical protein [Bradyrhizobium sp.]